MKMKIVDVKEANTTVVIHGPPPEPELGKNLVTFADCERWLLHPTNWVKGGTGILYWGGTGGSVPRLSARFAERLIRNPEDRPGFYAAVIHEQYEIKHGKKEDPKIEEPDAK